MAGGGRSGGRNIGEVPRIVATTVRVRAAPGAMVSGSPSIVCSSVRASAATKGSSPSAPGGTMPERARGSVASVVRRGSLLSGSAQVTTTPSGGKVTVPGSIGAIR